MIVDSPLKGFGDLLRTRIRLNQFSYHDFSKFITLFTEGKNDWELNSSLDSRPEN